MGEGEIVVVVYKDYLVKKDEFCEVINKMMFFFFEVEFGGIKLGDFILLDFGMVFVDLFVEFELGEEGDI